MTHSIIMKKNVSTSVIIMFLVLCHCVLHAQNRHNSVLFNSDWKFHKGDLDTGKGGLDTASWRSVELPHDWSSEGPFSQDWASGTGFAPAGIGWYRKVFRMPAKGDQQTFIYFDGVYNNSEVWINGHRLGKRPSGFVSFQYELTKFLRPNAENELLVRVDHSEFADSRWYTGSGIYRNVYLITTNRVHISLWGVAFTTPVANTDKADARVNVSIVNNAIFSTGAIVKCSLVDPKGTIIGADNKSLKIKQGDTVAAKFNITVKNPRLWSLEKPDLYRLIVTVTANGRVVDQWQDRVGIRDIRFDANEGFFLNGKNMKLKGVCLHDDAGVLGVAVPREVWYRRLKILKTAGVNAVRMSHNPHADYFYDLCDELGILVMDENFDEWEGAKNIWIKGWNQGKPGKEGSHEYFKDWGVRDMEDMVLRDRNHPSIIMWSIGNEIDYPGDPYVDSARATLLHPSVTRLGEVSRQLVNAVKRFDSSRVVTAALAGVEQSNKTTYPSNLDVVGYNYQENRYQRDHELYPKRIMFGSENSKQLYAWTAVENNKFIIGQFIWTGIDFLGEAHRWPDRSSGTGLLNMAGFPNAEYYFRQSLWIDAPVIKILTADVPKNPKSDAYPKQGQPNWNYKDGQQVRVNCFTNCLEAELFLNGQSLGKLKLADFESHVIHWDIPYQLGKLVVKGTAANGRIIFDTLKTSGSAYALKARSDVNLLDDHTHLAQVVIYIVDKNGLPVPNASNEITAEINGPVKLLGLESGALNSLEDYRSPTKKVFNGKLLAYIISRGKPGVSKVTFRSPGIKPYTVLIRTLAGR
jgi:beta-galactosidase